MDSNEQVFIKQLELEKRLRSLETLVENLFYRLDEKSTRDICQICGSKNNLSVRKCAICLKQICKECPLYIFNSIREIGNSLDVCSNRCLNRAYFYEKYRPISKLFLVDLCELNILDRHKYLERMDDIMNDIMDDLIY
jgi:hypothetical protein